jgi:hypothetical protein
VLLAAWPHINMSCQSVPLGAASVSNVTFSAQHQFVNVHALVCCLRSLPPLLIRCYSTPNSNGSHQSDVNILRNMENLARVRYSHVSLQFILAHAKPTLKHVSPHSMTRLDFYLLDQITHLVQSLAITMSVTISLGHSPPYRRVVAATLNSWVRLSHVYNILKTHPADIFVLFC